MVDDLEMLGADLANAGLLLARKLLGLLVVLVVTQRLLVVLRLIVIRGREDEVVLLRAEVVEVLDRHEQLARTLRVVRHLGVVLVTSIQEFALLVIDGFDLALLASHIVVAAQLLDLGLLLLLDQHLVILLRLVDVLFLLLLELVGLLLQLLVTGNNVVELLELVLVGVTNHLHESLVDAHLVDLGLDLLRLELVLLEFLARDLNLTVHVGNFLVLILLQLNILLLSVFLDLEVIRKFDQVVLNQNILLAEVVLLHFEAALFLAEVLLLVFKRFLHFIHEATLVKQLGRW